MNGMTYQATEAPSVGATSFLGILYAEDFDEPAHNQINAHPPKEPEPPPLTQADIDVACAEAVQGARLEWQREEERQRISALTTLATVLADIRGTCEQTTLSAAEGTVMTILSIVTGLLPEFSREHGPAEVRALLSRLLPTIQSNSKIAVRVHPALVSAIERDIGELEPDLASMIVVAAASLERADVKVTWENGSMTRDSTQIMQAIKDALSQLGLHHTVEAPTKRIMVYAD
jgi:flagellar biosynthesis/type III secretory pathway protein FliH